ncbi:MAG: radical SAM protein [Christensenellales bacterium]
MKSCDIKGKIHSLESLATLDGDGVRYGVFLVGCSLRCIYCHNPDTWANSEKYSEYTAQQLCDKISRYKPYFGQDGGVTFSGGEPLLQAQFVACCGKLLNDNGIQYALDTSGAVQLNDDVRQAIDGAELIILDIKMHNSADYRRYTHGNMELVLAFGDYCNSISKRMWLRTVVVPGINDTKDDMDAYLDVAARWSNVEKYELLGFHTMGFDKYEKLGIDNLLRSTSPMDDEKLKSLQQYIDNKRSNYD